MRVPYQDCFHLIEPLLAKVEKPSRYIDHEWGTLSKADADYRCCLIYPDVYEVGLPNQGIAILYNILNQAEGISCERGYVPWPDMGDAMREAGIPLLSLEGAAPVASFDIVGLHVPHEMAVTNFLEALDLAGIPLLAADRGEDDPIIIAGGPSVYNPEPYAAFFDAILIGEGEESLLETCQLHRRLRDEGVPRAQIVEQLASIAGNYVPSLYEVRHDEPCSPHGYTVPREGKDAPTVVYKRVVEDFGATNPLSQSCVPYAQLVHDRLSIEILRGCARGCRFCQAGMTYRPVRERSADQIVSSVIQGLEKTGVDLLVQAGRDAGLPVVTEITDISQLDLLADVDVLQVGARNMQNYTLLKALGQLRRPVLLKRGLSATVEEFLLAAEYLLSGGNEQVILCERGVRSGVSAARAALDVSAIPVLKRATHLPVLVDPSHAAGRSELVLPLALAAAAAGADGLMVEVHDRPACALSDGGQSLTCRQFRELSAAVTALLPYAWRPDTF